MRLELDKYNSVVGYICDKCNLYNDILTHNCRDCNSHLDIKYQQLVEKEIKRRGVDDEFQFTIGQLEDLMSMIENPKWLCSCGEINSSEKGKCKSLNPKYEHKFMKYLESENKRMKTEADDLFEKFYTHEKILISSMSYEEFKLHEEELAKVAFEAKARLTAVVDKKREDSAKQKANQKEWLMPRTDAEEALVSDVINTVQTRKKRLNKVEKLNEMLKGIEFLDEETRKKMIANVERKATDSSLTTFVNSKVKEAKEEIKDNTNGNNGNSEPKKPFDPSTLKFNK